jgi:hypothetical protein
LRSARLSHLPFNQAIMTALLSVIWRYVKQKAHR